MTQPDGGCVLSRLPVFFVSIALIAGPANAEWFEARTDHFVLTMDDTRENTRAFAERLERFDAALRRLYAVADNPDQRLRPLAVYSLDVPLFQKTCGCETVLGYYEARAKQSVIFSMHMPKVDKTSKQGELSSQVVLLHEYGHHFTFSNFPVAYPKWFAEGFAEFNATAEFKPDGSVLIGYPASYRAGSVRYGDVSVWDLFDADKFGVQWGHEGGFYGKGWLLTHYLMLGRNRPGQLAHYLDLINQGKSGRDAATLAFGDLKTLNTELFGYSNGLAPQLKIPASNQAVNVTLRALSRGEAEILPTYIKAQSGAPKDAMNALAFQAEQVGNRYPQDAIVQSERAEIEFDCGQLAKALEAADAALRIDGKMVDPLVVKGLVALDLAKKSKSTDQAAWKGVRAWFLAANRINTNAVMPLYEYYASFVAEGVQPPQDAVTALMRAEVLAPESSIVRLALARQMLLDGDSHGARALLAPLAYSPHADRAKNMPLQLIQLIDAGKMDEAKQLVTAKTNESAGKVN